MPRSDRSSESYYCRTTNEDSPIVRIDTLARVVRYSSGDTELRQQALDKENLFPILLHELYVPSNSACSWHATFGIEESAKVRPLLRIGFKAIREERFAENRGYRLKDVQVPRSSFTVYPRPVTNSCEKSLDRLQPYSIPLPDAHPATGPMGAVVDCAKEIRLYYCPIEWGSACSL